MSNPKGYEPKSRGYIPPLDGSNYSSWKFRIRVLLDNENLLKYILNENPQIKAEEKAAEASKEEKEDPDKGKRKTFAILVSHIAESQIHFAELCEYGEPFKLWGRLEQHFQSISAQSVRALRAKWQHLHITSDETAATFGARVQILARQLQRAGEEKSMNEIKDAFLGGMRNSFFLQYTMIFEQMNDEPLDQIIDRYAEIEIRENSRKNKTHKTPENVQVLQTNSMQSNKKDEACMWWPKGSCRRGDKCPYKHVGPSGATGKSNTPARCFRCDKVGHFKRDCPNKTETSQIVSEVAFNTTAKPKKIVTRHAKFPFRGKEGDPPNLHGFHNGRLDPQYRAPRQLGRPLLDPHYENYGRVRDLEQKLREITDQNASLITRLVNNHHQGPDMMFNNNPAAGQEANFQSIKEPSIEIPEMSAHEALRSIRKQGQDQRTKDKVKAFHDSALFVDTKARGKRKSQAQKTPEIHKRLLKSTKMVTGKSYKDKIALEERRRVKAAGAKMHQEHSEKPKAENKPKPTKETKATLQIDRINLREQIEQLKEKAIKKKLKTRANKAKLKEKANKITELESMLAVFTDTDKEQKAVNSQPKEAREEAEEEPDNTDEDDEDELVIVENDDADEGDGISGVPILMVNDHDETETKQNTEQTNIWAFDSGSSRSIGCSLSEFSSTWRCDPIIVSGASGHQYETTTEGTVLKRIMIDNQIRILTIPKVLYVPQFTTNLISIKHIDKLGNKTEFHNGKCTISNKTGEKVAGGTLRRNLYILDQAPIQQTQTSMIVNSRTLWHKRCGHSNHATLDKLEEITEGIKITRGDEKEVCEQCSKGKATRKPFPKQSKSTTSEPLELVHIDTIGPIKPATTGGNRYIFHVDDDYTHKVWACFLTRKSGALNAFKRIHRLITTLTGKTIKRVRSDNEFAKWKRFTAYCAQEGIHQEFTTPHSPQQNGKAERMGRTIMESARSMMANTNTPKTFWGEAVAAAIYLVNRRPTKALDNMTPEEAFTGRKPNLSHLRVWGCKAFANTRNTTERRKLDDITITCKFIGYDTQRKCYRFWRLDKNKLYLCRDAMFDETTFPKIETETEDDSNEYEPEATPEPDTEENSGSDTTEGEENSVEGEIENKDNGESSHESENSDTEQDEDPPLLEPPTPRRSNRPNKGKRNPRLVEESHVVQQVEDPTTVKQALQGEHKHKWEAAMKRELESLKENDTWKLTQLPPNRKAIKSKWIFKVKRNADGSIERFKARLVAKGFEQQYGTDFWETFAPVAKYKSIRILLALSAQEDYDIFQMDVETAYLNGRLEEEIYMKTPEGLHAPPNSVCKLEKGLYGLKQAGRIWNQNLNTFLLTQGFTQCETDNCLYVLRQGNDIALLAIYVDDLILATNNITLRKQIQGALHNRYKMKDLGELHWCLGMRITRDRKKRTITLDQERYIADMLIKYGMVDCNPTKTPADPNITLSKTMSPEKKEEKEDMDQKPYRNLVGSIMYSTTCTRPENAAATNAVCRFMENPGQQHWQAAKRILRYLKGTATEGITYKQQETTKNTIIGYCDSDWGSDPDKRRSTTGYVFKLAGGPISWNSKVQPTVALSSTEAEYMAACSAAQEATWIRQLLKELGFEQQGPTIIWEDNQGCIRLSENDSNHQRTKHIDIKHHFVREKVKSKEVELKYVPTKENVADIQTKALPTPLFEELRRRLYNAEEDNK